MTIYNNTFWQDNNVSLELGFFLEKHFYSELIKKEAILSYTCFYGNDEKSHDMQNKGVDVKIDYITMNTKKLKSMYLDEKAQIHYLNAPRPTFILELQSLKKGSSTETTDGWFLRDDLHTEYYELMWVYIDSPEKDVKKIKLSEVKEEDFRLVYLIMVSKKKIIEALDKLGWSKEKLLSKADKIRKDGIPNKRISVGKGLPFYFFYTSSLNEKPINLVMTISELYKLSNGKAYAITRTGFIPLSQCPDVSKDSVSKADNTKS